MAIRIIRKENDDILRKKSKEVTEVNQKILTLLDDMKDTLKACGNGVGLAAPQVGILKRIVVIDAEENGVLELINPRIIKTAGEQEEAEGCLSIPGKYGTVKRPKKVTIEAMNRHGDIVTITGEPFISRVFCHEIDHLDGILFTDKVIKYLDDGDVE